jgi:hypothetical protein
LVTDQSSASTKTEYQINLPHELQQLGKMDRSLNFKIHERFFLAVWGKLNSDTPAHAETSRTKLGLVDPTGLFIRRVVSIASDEDRDIYGMFILKKNLNTIVLLAKKINSDQIQETKFADLQKK